MDQHDSKRPAPSSSSSLPSSLLEELSQRLYRPDPRVNQVEEHVSIESTLSNFPCEIEVLGRAPAQQVAVNLAPAGAAAAVSASFPSYLDLRRQQNVAYAQEKTLEASMLIQTLGRPGSLDYDRNLQSIETLLQQALELVPDHLETLLAYANLLVDANKNAAKTKRLLNDALDVDPNNNDVKRLEARLNQQPQDRRLQILNRQGPPQAPLVVSHQRKRGTSTLQLTARESSAYQDALTERNLLAGSDDERRNHDGDGGSGDDSDDDDDDDDNDSDAKSASASRDRRDSGHRRRHDRKKEKRKHCRRDEKKRKKEKSRKKHSKKDKKRRSQREDSEESRRRKKHHRKRDKESGRGDKNDKEESNGQPGAQSI